MSEVNQKLENILDCINKETNSMDYNERAMVLLLVMEMLKCAVELDILDTLRPKKERTCKVESSFLNDFSSNHECWYEFELSCGHHVTSDVMEPPNYCEECGAKVVSA